MDWKRAGIAAGGLIVAVAAFGAWLGLQAGSEVEAQNLQAVNVPLPPATASEEAAAPSILNVPDDIMEQPASTRRYAMTRRAPVPRRSDPLAAVPEAPPTNAEPVSGTVPDGSGAAAEPVAEPAASLPLSNQTVARTLKRIGYACGSVESTFAVSAGVFRVNCSSGHSYQASPVRGRYRFRRI